MFVTSNNDVMNCTKEELEKLIFNEELAYEEIGRRYSVSGTYVKKYALRLGLILKVRAKFPKDWKPAKKGTSKHKNKCLCCKKLLFYHNKKYCSNKCQQKVKSYNAYKDFLEDNDKYCRANYMPKQFKGIFLREQNNCCAICSINPEWNNKTLVFVLDHIDGNAANNKRDNLRLVCPNCDSQLDTFKSKNKNSARKSRSKK